MTFLSRILITLINVPISMVVARKLGVEGQGAYAALLAVSGLCATLFLLGIDTAHTYYLAGRRYTLPQIVSHSIVWSLVLGLAATPTYLLLAPLIERQRTVFLAGPLTLSAAAVPLTIAKYLVLAVFLGEGRLERFNLLNVLSNLGLLLLLVALLLLAPGGVEEAVLAYVLSLGLLLLLGALWIRRRLAETGSSGWSLARPLFGKSLTYGLKGHLGNLVVQLTYRSDQILVTRILGLQAQGFYSIAVLLAEKLTHISASVQLVLFPRISGSTTEEANRLTPLACRLTFLVAFVAAIGLFLLGELLIRILYGARFLPALSSFQVLLPGIVILTLSKLLSGDLSGRNRRWGPTIAMCFGFALNLALNLLWIPRFGIVGAAWASTLAYAFQTAILVGIFWRVTGIGPVRLLRPGRQDLDSLRRVLRRRTWTGRA